MIYVGALPFPPFNLRLFLICPHPLCSIRLLSSCNLICLYLKKAIKPFKGAMCLERVWFCPLYQGWIFVQNIATLQRVNHTLPSSLSNWTSCSRKPLLGDTSLASFTWKHMDWVRINHHYFFTCLIACLRSRFLCSMRKAIANVADLQFSLFHLWLLPFGEIIISTATSGVALQYHSSTCLSLPSSWRAPSKVSQCPLPHWLPRLQLSIYLYNS